MLLLILLVAVFWVVVPGLLTGWMLREHGRSFLWGLLPGVLLGPAGILAALAFILVSNRAAHSRRPTMNSRRFRPFYHVPCVGRLHVSTAWSLAGVLTFLCAWMVGGIGYEFYTARLRRTDTARGPAARAAANQAAAAAAAAGITPNQLQAAPKAGAGAPSNSAAARQGGAMVSGLAAQTAQAAQASGRAETPPAQTGQAHSNPTAGLGQGMAPPAATSAGPSAPGTPPPPTERERGPSTASAVSEVARSLSSEGHRVHVAVSGDAQTATLSVSGPTLTRQAGNQLIGRTRHTLKGAGIRIVVMINGQESWTYIL